MAFTNIIEPGQAQAALTSWLSDRLPGAQGVQINDMSVPTASGYSCQTVLFTAAWVANGTARTEAMVARVAPPKGTVAVFPSYDLEREALIMRALAAHTNVPAPPVLFFEKDPSVLGGQFLIMRRIEGRIPADDPPYSIEGWVLQLSPDQQRTLIAGAVATLADLARVDWRRLGLDAVGRVGLHQQLAYLAHLYAEGGQGRSHPVIETGLQWLTDHAPKDERLAMCWGDARLGNFVFADDLSVAGALDWEVASIGSPETDISYFLYALRVWSEGFGVPSPPGFPSRQQILAEFEQRSAVTLRNVDYYERYAAVFGAIMAMRAGYVLIEAGQLPHDATMPVTNPASIALAAYLGVPAPSGDVTDWTGKR
jgi:aminoglycoside phosphotransferase (APT) family kinase protein